MPSSAPPYNNLLGAIDHLHNELYVIKQQLRFYSDLTIHEETLPISTRADTFSTAMAHLAEQVETAMEYTEALKNYIRA